eukprot:c36635_g1_i1 orf=113-301(+)
MFTESHNRQRLSIQLCYNLSVLRMCLNSQVNGQCQIPLKYNSYLRIFAVPNVSKPSLFRTQM